MAVWRALLLCSAGIETSSAWVAPAGSSSAPQAAAFLTPAPLDAAPTKHRASAARRPATLMAVAQRSAARAGDDSDSDDYEAMAAIFHAPGTVSPQMGFFW